MENMVDFESLNRWPLDKLITAQGFVCTYCGAREAVSYSTISLQEAEGKLTRYAPTHPQFQFLFAKVLRKTIGVHARGQALNGTLQRPHVAESGPLG